MNECEGQVYIFTPLLEANIFLPLNTLQKVGWVGEREVASHRSLRIHIKIACIRLQNVFQCVEWVRINTEANFAFVFLSLLNVVLSCVGFSALICWGLSSPTLHGRLLSQDTSTNEHVIFAVFLFRTV